MTLRSTFALLTTLALTTISCGRGGDEEARFHDDGRAKPSVAIAPMIDTSSFECGWNLSEELTSLVAKELAKTGAIYVRTKDDVAFTDNPFGTNLSWVKAQFPPNQEFAVFLELVKHEAVPEVRGEITSPQELSHNLNMAVRLRVIDLRGPTPKIVLQEMVRDSYFIPKTLLPTNYNEVVWGSEEYGKTPMAVAHAHLVDAITDRLNDYILLAKSR